MSNSQYEKECYITPDSHPDNWRNHVSVKTMEQLADHIKGDVLDIGCNAGTKTYWLRLFDIKSVVGIDVNPSSLEVARRNFADFPYPSRFQCMNAVVETLDTSFDTIVCFHAFEHIYPQHVPDFLRNVKQMLNDDAYLIMGMPYDTAYNDPCHVAWYREDSLRSVMESAGFEVVSCYRENRWNAYGNLIGLFKG